MIPILLTRDVFRNSVFERDKWKCVICGKKGIDAHHIIERRLFPDGGYYVDNGATLCSEHHIQAEQTVLSCDSLREAAGITSVILPPHLYPDEKWDKWGNLILNNSQRVRGELFEDESVQKILQSAGVLSLFTPWVKYPRTYHLPNSPGVTKDDRVLTDLSFFRNKRVVVTEKRDGENTTIYPNYVHPRSLTMSSHPSRSWIMNFASKVGCNIPNDWRVCGENLFAKHSIFYENLSCYFEAFSIWNSSNICLDWDTTIEWFNLLGLFHVPVLYDGPWKENLIEQFIPNDTTKQEGFVIRVSNEFPFSQFRNCVAKWVRPGHVETSHHWRFQPVIKNQLKQK